MTEFWKQPKFWAAAILVLWLAYVIGSNLEQIVIVHIVPGMVHPMVKVSTNVASPLAPSGYGTDSSTPSMSRPSNTTLGELV